MADVSLARSDDNTAAGNHEIEQSPQESARGAVRDQAAADRRAAVALIRSQRLEEALTCWERVASAAPDDLAAAQTVSRLTIELGRRRAGLGPRVIEEPADAAVADLSSETAGPETAAPLAVQQPAADAPRSPAGIKLTPVQQLEGAIRDQPANPEFYLRLVPLYLEKERDYDAERLLEKGKEASGDARVRQLWEDVTMLRMEKKIEFAHKEAERDDTPQKRAELVQLRAERDRWEIEVFTTRCQRQPANLALRYELGLRLKRAGKLRTACQEFQEALASPAHKADAAFQLGECLAQFFEYPEALKFYRLAADAALASNQLERRKESLYRAAELASRVKLRSPARRYLAELHKIDPHYRDAAGLLEKLPQVVV